MKNLVFYIFLSVSLFLWCTESYTLDYSKHPLYTTQQNAITNNHLQTNTLVDSEDIWSSNKEEDFKIASKKSNYSSIPSFLYLDFELIGSNFSDKVGFNSAIFADLFIDPVMIHAGIYGVWGTPGAFVYEAGVGYALSKTFQRNVPVTQVFYEGREYYGGAVYDRYKIQKGHADKVALHLVEGGIRGFAPFYTSDKNPDWNPVVYGKQFNSITEVEYYAYDTIIYAGYRFMSLRSRALTTNEFIFNINAMLGIKNRRADVWDNSSNMFQARKSGNLAFGFEAGIRWYTVYARLGYYDSYFFGGIGLRFGINTL
ncbi:MAG: hypothetical protein OEV44_14915 [Spirochaetota bacterium]|nr:hypothetical protein [Spirochaetota bacterium]